MKSDEDSSEDGWIDVSHSEDEINIKSEEIQFAKGQKRKVDLELDDE